MNSQETIEKQKQAWLEFINKSDLSLLQILRYAKSRTDKGKIHDIGFTQHYLIHQKDYHEYLHLLSQHCCQSAALTDVSILYKLFRPYEVATYTIPQRLEVLKEHYRILSKYFTDDQFDELGKAGGLIIKPYPVTDTINIPYHLCFQYNGTHRREAELTLSIVRAFEENNDEKVTYKRVFSIAFNFGIKKDQQVIKINSIQGSDPHFEDPLKEISNVTKLGFGLMPKYLMINLAFHIAQITNSQSVLAIRTNSHVYANPHYVHRIGDNTFKYDYDKQWEEFNATAFDDNYVQLQATERTPIEKIATKKRSQHRKRYAFIDEIYASLDQIFKYMS